MQYLFHLPRVDSAIHLSAVQYSDAKAGWEYPNHRHPYFEFLYCVNGELEQWVNGNRFDLAGGSSMVIKSGMYHRTKIISDCKFFDFHFDIETPEIHSIFQTISDPFIPGGSETSSAITRWVERYITNFGKKLGDWNGKQKKMNIEQSLLTLQMHSSVVEFIAFLAEYFLQNEKQSAGTAHPSHLYIAHQTAYLLNNDNDFKMNINGIAEKLNLHRSHITNCFKQVYGVTPKRYITQLRLQKAKQLLVETHLSIEEIAEKLSFSSTSHFTKFFTAHMGCNPSRYRIRSN